MSRLLSGLIIAVSLGFLVAACAPAAKAPEPAKEAASEAGPLTPKPITPADKKGPSYGGVMRIYHYDWPSLDPHQVLIAAMQRIGGQIFEGLLTYEQGPHTNNLESKVVPLLAEKWEQPNDTTYVFYLRKGVKFQNVPPVNGRELTAEDVVYSIKRMSTPGWVSSSLFESLDKVEAVDKYTVKFTLKEPTAAFLTFVANGYANAILTKESVEAGGGHLKQGPLIGTGPFILEEAKERNYFVVRRNSDYWRKDPLGNQLPYLDGIRGFIIPDESTRYAALRAKQLDWYSIPFAEVENYRKSYPDMVLNQPGGAWTAGNQFGIKVDRPPFNDVRVRSAVSHAINRWEVFETVVGRPREEGFFTLHFPLPGMDWLIPQEEYEKAFKYDPEMAKKLLAEAGYPNGFDVTLTCANYGQSMINQCEMVTNYLSKVGIRAKMKVVDSATYSGKVYTLGGDFDVFVGPSSTFFDADQLLSASYHSKGTRNHNGINDPKLDQLIEAQRKEMNSEKRKALLQEIQRYLIQQNYHYHATMSNKVGSFSGVWSWMGNYSGQSDYPTGRFYSSMWMDQDLAKEMGRPKDY